jgi:transcriptional regulator with GAF, ATPase, and Fis domain
MEERIMSAVEFGPTSQTPFVYAAEELSLAHPSTGLESLTARYERLAQLSRSIASMTSEILSRDLVRSFQALFPCDLVNIVLFDQGDGAGGWKSYGDEQLVRQDMPIEETTLWSVYEEQRALWVADCQLDERAAVRKEGENVMTVGYRSLCRLPLCTARGCFGVLSIAGSAPYRHSEQDTRFLLLAADQVALGLANWLLHAEVAKQRRTKTLQVTKDDCRRPLPVDETWRSSPTG